MAKLKYMKNIVCALIFLLIANNGYTQVNPETKKGAFAPLFKTYDFDSF